MAGGVGSRFWPESRESKPKQLLNIFNDKSLIQNTVNRLDGIVANNKIFIITNKIQKPGVIEQLPQIPEENIVEEPFGKNTAACIGLASVLVAEKNNEAITLVLPADHRIENEDKFREIILSAAAYAEKSNGLVTIGIKPTRPETGYGYIQTNDPVEGDNIFHVKTFAEKPNYETAKRFVEAGDFYWNSGMFIWKVSAILEEMKELMPELYEGVCNIRSAIDQPDFVKVLQREYGQFKSISIDYGIMEHSKNVFLIKGEFDWSDVGSWEAVYQLSSKSENENVLKGDIYTEDLNGSFIRTKKKFTAVVGVENLIVIETEDALLICDRDKAQSVKQVVDHLKLNKKVDLI